MVSRKKKKSNRKRTQVAEISHKKKPEKVDHEVYISIAGSSEGKDKRHNKKQQEAASSSKKQ
tara:strand:+ start:58 stop:243 length:186 start_codon:yes stop_codon:yes gene_type:complete